MNATANSNMNNSSGRDALLDDEENQQSNDDREEDEEEEECNFPLNLVATQMGSDTSQH